MATRRQRPASLLAQARDAARDEVLAGSSAAALCAPELRLLELSGDHDAWCRQLEAIGLRAAATRTDASLYCGAGLACVVRRARTQGPPRPSAVGIGVEEAPAALAWFERLGARRWPSAVAPLINVNIPAIYGPAGTHLYLLDEFGQDLLYQVDFAATPAASTDSGPCLQRLVYCLPAGQALYWARWLQHALGLVPKWPDESTRSAYGVDAYVLHSTSGRFAVWLIEPGRTAGNWLRRNLQQRGPGLRLLGFAAANAASHRTPPGAGDAYLRPASGHCQYFAAADLLLDLQPVTPDCQAEPGRFTATVLAQLQQKLDQ